MKTTGEALSKQNSNDSFSTLIDEENTKFAVINQKTYSTILDEDFTKEEEKRLVRKLDLRIMPMLCLFYFVDYLDRANIGYAKLSGIQKDLSMTEFQLSVAISAFFVTYVIFEVPSNVILKMTDAARWLSFIMFIWGIATLFTAFVRNFIGLFITRLVLGAAESGYIPGILFLLSKLYKPQELSLRASYLVTMATLSSICSGPLAYLASYLGEKYSLYDWRCLYVIEGIPTILLSIVSYFYLFDDVQNVKWLSPKQKAIQTSRMYSHQKLNTGDKITFDTFKTVILDWKTWAFACINFATNVNITSISIFLPTIIKGFGFDNQMTRLLATPPALSSTVCILSSGYIACKSRKKSCILAFGATVCMIALSSLLMLENKWALYASLCFLFAGIGLQSSFMAWMSMNYHDLSVRAVAIATVLTIGSLGFFFASYLFQNNDAPRYVFSLLMNLVASLTSLIVTLTTGYLLYRENCRRDRNPNESNQFRYYY